MRLGGLKDYQMNAAINILTNILRVVMNVEIYISERNKIG